MVKLHVSLNVSDLDRSIAFYEAFLDAAPHKRRPAYANFDVDTPPLKLALNAYAVAPGIGALSHLGIVVDSAQAVEDAKQRLIRAGLATFDERDTTCCYARQDKIWVHDPDGNAWEVYHLVSDVPDEGHHDHDGRPLDGTARHSLTALSVPLAPQLHCCGPAAGPAE